jgi:uncharacterized protein
LTPAASPAAAPGRVETLDLLRGLAVLGILAVNAAAFSMPEAWAVVPSLRPPQPGADLAAWTVVRVLFEAKFYTLFSMLFGVSLYLVGRELDDAEGGRRLARRLAWLALFGLLHGALIWYGDILLSYAIAGLLVMWVRSWPPGPLLAVGITLHVLFGIQDLGAALEPGAVFDLERWRLAADAALTGYRGDFASSLAANLTDWRARLGPVIVSSGVALAPLMLIGLGLFKAGVLGGRAPAPLYAALIAAGAVALALQGWLTLAEARSGHAFREVALAQLAVGLFAPLATVAYASLLILALRAGARPLAAVLAPVGRLALTQYLTQSLVMTALFYGGRGPGLYGRLDHAELWPIVAAIWLAQIAVSPLWLSAFAYGPFEWVWRSLTLGRPVPIRRRPAPG